MSLKNLINYGKKIISKKNDFNNLKDINLFGMMSTLLTNFLPEIPVEDHIKIYKENLIYETYKTETHTKEGKLIHKKHTFTANSFENLEKLKKEPHIITTFHLGMYLATGTFLYENGIEFSALISSNGLYHNGNRFRDIMKNNYDFDLKLIDAEKTNSAISLLKELKSGKSILIYLDGNLGAIEKKENLCDIDFLSGKINVRKGVSFISFLSKTPIVNVINYINKDNDIVFHISDPFISIDKNDDKVVMQKLWGDFSEFLKEHPEQWEVWRYLHRSLLDKSKKQVDVTNSFNDIDDSVSIANINKTYSFNLLNYSLFLAKEDTYIMDKEKLISYYISTEFDSLLKESLFDKIVCSQKNFKIINHLLSKKLLMQIN